MNFTFKTVTVGETYIHVVSCGKGEPIILLHGLTNNWESQIPLASVLCKHYTVIMVDLPGYGDSGQLSKYSIPIMASYLLQLIAMLEIKPLSIIGLSMGGFVTTEFAKAFPEHTRSAVILGPVFRDKHYKIRMMKYALKSADVIPAGRSMFKKLIETKYHAYAMAKYVNMHRFDKQLVDLYGRNGNKKMTKDVYIDMGISITEYNTEQAITQVHVPTLLLYGKHDRISAPGYAKMQILPKNPYLRLNVIEEAGHWVSVEKPDDTATAIISFLKQNHRDVSLQVSGQGVSLS